MIKFAMVGAGRIAGRFVQEAATIEGISVDVVCSLHKSSASRFAKKWNIPRATDNIEDISDHVDAVYIATPHEFHYEYSKMMLQMGKHVLCEKPMALSEAQANDLFALAQRQGLVLMEGIKTAYCPGFLALMELANSGIIGRISSVEACMTKLIPTNMREMTSPVYGGSFTELGTYALLPAIKLFGIDYDDLSFRFQRLENGLDGFTKVELGYGERWATAKTGLSVKSEGQLLISGTRGYILAKSPWWLTRQFDVCFEDVSKNKTYHFEYQGPGLRYEIKAFIDAIHGDPVNDILPKESICMAKIMEESLRHRDGYLHQDQA